MLKTRVHWPVWVIALIVLAGAGGFLGWWINQKASAVEFTVNVEHYDALVLNVAIQNTMPTEYWPRNTFVMTTKSAKLEGPLTLGLLLDAQTSEKYIMLKGGPEACRFEIASEQVFLTSSVINEGDQITIRLLSPQQAASRNKDRLEVKYYNSMTYCPVIEANLEAVTLGGTEENQHFTALLAGEVERVNLEPVEEYPLEGGLGQSTNRIPAKNWAWAIDPFIVPPRINPFALLISLTGSVSDDLGKVSVPAREQLWLLLSLRDEANLTFEGVDGTVIINENERRRLDAVENLEIRSKPSLDVEAVRILFSEGSTIIQGEATSLIVTKGEQVEDLMPKRGGPAVGTPSYWAGLVIATTIGIIVRELLVKTRRSEEFHDERLRKKRGSNASRHRRARKR